MTEQHDKLVVSQEAREVAKSLLGRDDAGPSWWSIDSGKADVDPMVQAFIRAMTQAAEAARADAFEEAAKVADEYSRTSASKVRSLPEISAFVRGGNSRAQRIATAIRAKAVGNG